MDLTRDDTLLLAALEGGLPRSPWPYADLGKRLGWPEELVLSRLEQLIDSGVISRFGVIVRHHELGYHANAMAVWRVPKNQVADAGRTLAAQPFVSLAYKRTPRPPRWPYNLYCMVHGRDKTDVETLIEQAAEKADLAHLPGTILFSVKRFKQCGARYMPAELLSGAG